MSKPTLTDRLMNGCVYAGGVAVLYCLWHRLFFQDEYTIVPILLGLMCLPLGLRLVQCWEQRYDVHHILLLDYSISGAVSVTYFNYSDVLTHPMAYYLAHHSAAMVALGHVLWLFYSGYQLDHPYAPLLPREDSDDADEPEDSPEL